MAIADTLTDKELELANLVDWYNEHFTGTEHKYRLKKGRKLNGIIMNLVAALNQESGEANYMVRHMGQMILYKNNQAISDREFYDRLREGN